MFNLNKTLIICFIACSFFMCLFSPAWSGKGDINLKIKGQALSVNLKEIPLKFILEKLKRERGIWFQGDESLFEEEITVQFKDLTFQDGLKSILSPMNYSLVFGPNERLEGVFIIGKGKARPTTGRGTAIEWKKYLS